jgi:hypothetical protein
MPPQADDHLVNLLFVHRCADQLVQATDQFRSNFFGALKTSLVLLEQQ